MVQDRQVVLIDENTGRAMPGRRLADGLHQAIEQKKMFPYRWKVRLWRHVHFKIILDNMKAFRDDRNRLYGSRRIC